MKAINNLLSYKSGGNTNPEHTHFVFHGVSLRQNVGAFKSGDTFAMAIVSTAGDPYMILGDKDGKQHTFNLKFIV